MQYFLDLERVAPEFSKGHGLIPLDKDLFEAMVQNDPKLLVENYAMDERHIVATRGEPEAPKSGLTKLREAGKAFFQELAKWDGEELQSETIADLLAEHVTPKSRAQLAMQVLMLEVHPSNCDDPVFINRDSKVFAVTLAETLGPESAQWLYHFAKLVTKLA